MSVEMQLLELKELFDMIDVDKDGIITLADLSATFTNLGQSVHLCPPWIKCNLLLILFCF